MYRQLLSFLLIWQMAPAFAQDQPPTGHNIEQAPATSAGSDSVKSNYILRTTTGNIYGTLVLPEKKQRVPVVLIIAGSGPTDRNGNSPGLGLEANVYHMLADSLLRHGIASLRYDKRGVGESAAAMRSESDLTFEDMISDAMGWIKLLKADDRFSKIVVLGHSEGSLIGMVAAREGNADGYVSVSGAGERADKILSKQLHARAPQLAEKADLLMDSLSKGHMVQEPGGTLNILFRASVQPYIMSWFLYDPQQEIKKLKIPILILQGRTDLQVSVEDAQALKNARPEATLVLIDGMNHVLKQAPADFQQNVATYHSPALPLKSQLVSAICLFVLRREGKY